MCVCVFGIFLVTCHSSRQNEIQNTVFTLRRVTQSSDNPISYEQDMGPGEPGCSSMEFQTVRCFGGLPFQKLLILVEFDNLLKMMID